MKWVNGATWAVFLLPHMEQDNLYRKWKLDHTYYHPVNDGARAEGVRLLNKKFTVIGNSRKINPTQAFLLNCPFFTVRLFKNLTI